MTYYYGTEEYSIPLRHIYNINESQGGGVDLLASFFTEAFRKHNVSIIEYKTLFANTGNILTKEQSKKMQAAQTYYVVECIGVDQWGRKVVGIGEVSAETITNYQRKYPYNLAAKRARTSMGKEIFGITDVKMAIDCRDYIIPAGKHKGKTIEEVAKIDINTLNWMKSNDFNSNDQSLKPKIEEYFEKYLNKNNNNQNRNNQNPDNINEINEKNEKKRAMLKLEEIKTNKNLTNKLINQVAKKEIEGFSWKTANSQQVYKLIEKLNSNVIG